jgi:putative transposase
VIVLQAYRFALDPTPRQQRALASHVGGARFAHNWGLELVSQRLNQRAAGQEVEVPWTLPALRREWNRAKAGVAPWWADNSKEAYSSGLDALARGLKNWADSKAGRRAGAPVGFPRPKRKGRGRQACRFTTGAIRVEADRHHVTLPRLGRLKTHESTRKLARRLGHGSARILSATISRHGGRWFCSFTCLVQRAQRRPRRPAATVGVDVGVRQLAVLSSGEQVANPRPLSAALGKLRRLCRQLARRQGPRAPDGTLQAPSARWRQTQGELLRLHAGREPARRGAAPAHHPPDARVRHGGGGASQRRWDGASPSARPGHRRQRHGQGPQAARLQVCLGRRPTHRGPDVLPVVEDLLGLWAGESQAGPLRADLSLPGVRAGAGP